MTSSRTAQTWPCTRRVPSFFVLYTNTTGDCTSMPRLATSCAYPSNRKGKMQDGPLQSPCVLAPAFAGNLIIFNQLKKIWKQACCYPKHNEHCTNNHLVKQRFFYHGASSKLAGLKGIGLLGKAGGSLVGKGQLSIVLNPHTVKTNPHHPPHKCIWLFASYRVIDQTVAVKATAKHVALPRRLLWHFY